MGDCEKFKIKYSIIAKLACFFKNPIPIFGHIFGWQSIASALCSNFLFFPLPLFQGRKSAFCKDRACAAMDFSRFIYNAWGFFKKHPPLIGGAILAGRVDFGGQRAGSAPLISFKMARMVASLLPCTRRMRKFLDPGIPRK